MRNEKTMQGAGLVSGAMAELESLAVVSDTEAAVPNTKESM